jgi:RNA polymerase sigma factor (sigma-70 family)
MAPKRDPLANPKPLVRRLYSYVAYRIGDGPDAEDVTAETFARAVRSRHTYDQRRGAPITWLMAISRSVLSDRTSQPVPMADLPEPAPDESFADRTATRLEIQEAVAQLPERERELIGLRYGADLTARQIGELLQMTPHAVESALSRAVAHLRESLESIAV